MLEAFSDLGWELGGVEGGHALDAGDVGGRHDAGDDRGARRPRASELVDVLLVVVGSVAELGDGEVGGWPGGGLASLGGLVLEVGLDGGGHGVTSGWAATAMSQLVRWRMKPASSAAVSKAWVGAVDAVLGQSPREGEDVVDAVVLVVLDDRGDLVAGVGDAGEVRHGFDAEVVADLADPVSGGSAGGAAGAVGDGHKVGPVSGETGEGLGVRRSAPAWSRGAENSKDRLGPHQAVA